MRMLLGGVLVGLGVSACASRPEVRPREDACELPREWVQATLDLWERTTADVLQRPTARLPHIVYFDRRCTYTLGVEEVAVAEGARPLAGLTFRGRSVPVWAEVHGGEVHLPNGMTFAPRAHATGAMTAGPEPRPFYAMALMEIWRSELPEDKQGEHLSDEFLTIAQHELTHTLQLPGIFAAARRIAERAGLTLELDDDQIQARFETDPAYVKVYQEELALLRRASLTPRVDEKKRLVRAAVEMARARQARWFVGEHAPFAELDGLFLSMEGLGEWVRFRLMTAGPVGALPRQTREEAIARLDGKKPFWSQQEGLAILLVLEQLHPAFRDRLLAEDLPDAFVLLEEAAGQAGEAP